MISRLKDLPWDSVPKFMQRIIIITLILCMLASFTISFSVSIYWWILGIILIDLISLIILISGSQISFFTSLLLGLGIYLVLMWLVLYLSIWVLGKKRAEAI